MVDECPQCGNRGVATARKYEKERKRNLSVMMEGFASEADNPENCAHALHTLMVYNMESWFQDVQKSYGLRFETNMQIQYLIAQGLSRFGKYKEAMVYCRKAIVLGAGKQAEELLTYCQTLLEASEGTADLEALRVQPESTLRAYVPLITMTASAAIYVVTLGMSSLHTYKAWIVNGTLKPYTFTLDDEAYELLPGATKLITLQLGEHELKSDSMPTRQFTYSVPLIRQLLNKHLLVINPDSMALLTYHDISDRTDKNKTSLSYEGQIRTFPGLIEPQHGLRKIEDGEDRHESISLYRPDTHLAMIQLMTKLGLNDAAVNYARRALMSTPSSDESPALLKIALNSADDATILSFLRAGLDTQPMLMPWHLYYQNYMQIHHPESNLEREYTVYCKNNPSDPQSYYLLARVVKDRKTAYSFYEHADKQKGMGGRGLYAIAHDLWLRGEFSEALPYAERAVRMAPDNQQVTSLQEQILLALRDYDTLLAQTLEGVSHMPADTREEKKVLYLTCAGYHKQAADEIARTVEKHSAAIPRLNAIRYYSVGNVDDYLDCLADMGNPHSDMEKYLHTNKLVDADNLISKEQGHPYWEHLVLYCAAMSQNNLEVAERNMSKAIDEAGTASPSHYQLARLLQGEDEVTLDAIRSLDIDAPEKTILCVALGYRFPERQQEFHDLALTYNFTPAYPQLLVKKWVRGAMAARTAPKKQASQTVALGM